MHKHGITDTTISVQDVQALPEGMSVVLDGRDPHRVRIRLTKDADAERWYREASTQA